MKTRIVTAIVLLTVTVTVILWLPGVVFTGFLLTISVLAAWEWCRMIPRQISHVAQAGYCVVVAALLLGATLYEPSWVPLTLGASVVWLVIGGGILCQIFRIYIVQIRSNFFLGLLILVPGPVALIAVHGNLDQGRLLVLLSCVVVWATDTFAFVVGKRFGRRKLAPRLSPGKTIEGTLGGIVGAVGTGVIFFYMFMEDNKVGGIGFETWCLVVASVAVMAVIGDLTESAVKRSADQKDSGVLLPGHGGVLDRIDSLLCAAPIFAGWMFLCDKGATLVLY